MPPPTLAGWLQEHGSTSCSQDVLPAHHWPPLNPLGFTNLSWMEINAAVGPPGCSCILSACVYVRMPCLFKYGSEGSSHRWIPRWRKSLLLLFDPFGSALCVVTGFQSAAFGRVCEMYPRTLSYITLLDGVGGGGKGKRKEPVFHPISLERQCCALVIV